MAGRQGIELRIAEGDRKPNCVPTAEEGGVERVGGRDDVEHGFHIEANIDLPLEDRCSDVAGLKPQDVGDLKSRIRRQGDPEVASHPWQIVTRGTLRGKRLRGGQDPKCGDCGTDGGGHEPTETAGQYASGDLEGHDDIPRQFQFTFRR